MANQSKIRLFGWGFVISWLTRWLEELARAEIIVFGWSSFSFCVVLRFRADFQVQSHFHRALSGCRMDRLYVFPCFIGSARVQTIVWDQQLWLSSVRQSGSSISQHLPIRRLAASLMKSRVTPHNFTVVPDFHITEMISIMIILIRIVWE
jgi:hypothetical protein